MWMQIRRPCAGRQLRHESLFGRMMRSVWDTSRSQATYCQVFRRLSGLWSTCPRAYVLANRLTKQSHPYLIKDYIYQGFVNRSTDSSLSAKGGSLEELLNSFFKEMSSRIAASSFDTCNMISSAIFFCSTVAIESTWFFGAGLGLAYCFPSPWEFVSRSHSCQRSKSFLKN